MRKRIDISMLFRITRSCVVGVRCGRHARACGRQGPRGGRPGGWPGRAHGARLRPLAAPSQNHLPVAGCARKPPPTPT